MRWRFALVGVLFAAFIFMDLCCRQYDDEAERQIRNFNMLNQ